jgi:FkbM family methyltransferase
LVNKSFQLDGVENTFRTVNDRLNQLTSLQALALQSGKPLVEACRINNQILFVSRPTNSGLGDSVWRMENDYYLSQTAVFREGDTVVDVGAHLGISAIYLAKKFPFIRVYALEPEPNNYDCLQRNIALNGVTNVVAINKALSGDGETKTLYSDPLMRTWATIDATMASSRHLLQAVQIETVTLADLFREYDIQQCRMLKISALGAVRKSLEAFSEQGRIDFLCGETDLEDCSKVRLEVASWRIARQHFWRTFDLRPEGTVYSWIHQMPTEIERI